MPTKSSLLWFIWLSCAKAKQCPKSCTQIMGASVENDGTVWPIKLDKLYSIYMYVYSGLKYLPVVSVCVRVCAWAGLSTLQSSFGMAMARHASCSVHARVNCPNTFGGRLYKVTVLAWHMRVNEMAQPFLCECCKMPNMPAHLYGAYSSVYSGP